MKKGFPAVFFIPIWNNCNRENAFLGYFCLKIFT